MSLESWKKKYYPKPAGETTLEEAIDHSLRKWEGLTPEALAEHELLKTSQYLVDSNIETGFYVADDTCALCLHHPECKGCPLVDIRGDRCDKPWDDSPYGHWTETGDPGPMLDLLREAKRGGTKC